MLPSVVLQLQFQLAIVMQAWLTWRVTREGKLCAVLVRALTCAKAPARLLVCSTSQRLQAHLQNISSLMLHSENAQQTPTTR